MIIITTAAVIIISVPCQFSDRGRSKTLLKAKARLPREGHGAERGHLGGSWAGLVWGFMSRRGCCRLFFVHIMLSSDWFLQHSAYRS